MRKQFLFAFFGILLAMSGFGQTQVDLPVTFDVATVNYNLVDFGGNISSIVIDPIAPTNKVCKVIKTATAESWAGTTIGGPAGMATTIPFAPGFTIMTMRVFSPNAGVPVLMKVEVVGAPSQSVETQAFTTIANGWETLEFNFANQTSGNPMNFGLSYKVLSVFFNFNIPGSVAGEKIYYCDDIAFGQSGPVPLNLPVTFDNPNVNYDLVDFGGNISNIEFDPVVPTNKVCKVIKPLAAELWAGTTIGGATGFATAIPFASNATKISMRVYSPDAGIPVRMKVEDPLDPGKSVETEKLTTVANGWETLEFNFANQASGTAPINFTYTYKKMSVFFIFGTTGAIAGSKTYYCDDIAFVPPVVVLVDLPVTFDNPIVNYNLVDFGGNVSSIVNDPVVPTNKVCKVIKSATAELWAGTTIGGAAGLATPIPFALGATIMTMRVYSPNAGIPVRMKVEDPNDAGKSVETEALTTMANGWETLEFNFANQASGTAPINFTYTYKKLSVFFNFGTTGAIAGEKTYYCDDIAFGPAGPTPVNLPVTFDNPNVNYDLVDFGGNISAIVIDPVVPTNKVCKTIKINTAELWAGTTIGGTIGFATPIPFVPGATKILMRVYSPDAGIPVRMKVEDPNDGGKSVETEKFTTVSNTWETLEFNFANPATGSNPINFTYTYKKLSVFFNFGTTGAVAGEKTYYFDDIVFGPPAPIQVDLPINFDNSNVNYDLVDFGGNFSVIEFDPVAPTTKVCKTIKISTAESWAGTTIGGAAGLATAIPFALGATKMTMRVYSPDAGIPIRMKVEDPNDAAKSVETEAITTGANSWETLEFNFANPAPGSNPLNFTYMYKKLSVFFNFGTAGAVAGTKTYYFDDIVFKGYTPTTINVTFQVQGNDSSLVYIFGNWNNWGNWPGTPMNLIGNGVYSVTLPFIENSSHEFQFVNGNPPVKEVLDPAWLCTNGNPVYTNRVLTLGASDTIICLNWSSCNSCNVPIVPTNRTLENITVVAEQGSCYDATQTITVAGNNSFFRVEEFGEVTLVAGQKITILPGAQVMSGGYLHAHITATQQYCTLPAAREVKSIEIQEIPVNDNGALSVRIFPNPTSSDVTLDLQGVSEGAQAKFDMISIRGEKLRTGELTGNGKHPLSLNGISVGVYYIRIICGDQVVTRMIMKR
ncbi:MAG: T9SS type A sorting domain-containing protein [Bacteroidota bacterium]